MRLLLVALAAVLLLAPAFGHDSWISRGGHRNAAGEWCCGDGDCGMKVAGEIHASSDGYHVDAVFAVPGTIQKAVHEIVPYSQAQPSPDGQFWRCKRPDGSRRCFFAPPPSM
jgi:hypothetical protein